MRDWLMSRHMQSFGTLMVASMCPPPECTAHLGGGPQRALLLLLLQHGLQDGHHPVLKLAVVAVGDQHVPDAVEARLAQLSSPQVELPREGGSQALQGSAGRQGHTGQ